MPAAVEHPGISSPDRRPVGVVVGGGYAAALVGVEIQILGQFVAQHPHDGRIPVGEGGVVGGGAGFGGSVAVQIVADGVQLIQILDFGQPVVVGVVGGERVHCPLRRGVEDGVLAGGAEPPGAVAGAVADDVDVPLGVDAGVAGGGLQLGGGLALHGDAGAAAYGVNAGGGGAMHFGVAVAVVDRGAAAGDLADQSAGVGAGVGGRHRAGGVAGGDGAAAVAGEAADVGAGAGAAVDFGGGVAGLDRAEVAADQSAADPGGGGGGDHAALGVAGADRGPRPDLPGQGADERPDAAHPRVHHPHIPDRPRGVDDVEQPAVERAAGDGQVGDGMAVAVEHRGVDPADGGPVGVGIRGGHRAAAVGVEVQILLQFVAGADAAGAAHPGVGGDVAGRERPHIRRGGGGRRPVAVQIPTDGVQLIQIRDLDQPVIVVIVVEHPLIGAVQPGVVAGRAEMPGVVDEGVRVQVDVPVGVDAGVAGGGLQLRCGVAGGGDDGVGC